MPQESFKRSQEVSGGLRGVSELLREVSGVFRWPHELSKGPQVVPVEFQRVSGRPKILKGASGNLRGHFRRTQGILENLSVSQKA